MTAQNIYDKDEFFQAYKQLPRSIEGLDGAPEWPTLCAMLPNIRGARIVDLGCGFGWFCRWARANGAAQVLGLDLSENMLAQGRAVTSDPQITYSRVDLEHVELPPKSFDLAYSSLALHYLENLDRFVAQVAQSLSARGGFVFSVEHPIYTAPANPGWTLDSGGRKTWSVNGYLDEGARVTDWLSKGVIKQHRTIATYLNTLLRHGFAIRQIEEWGPTPSQVESHPEWAEERERPPFLLISARL